MKTKIPAEQFISLYEALQRISMQMEGVLQQAKSEGKELFGADFSPLRQAQKALENATPAMLELAADSGQNWKATTRS